MKSTTMKHTAQKMIAVALLGFSCAAFSLDATEQRYIDQLTEGSMRSVKDAAQDIFNSGEDNQVVLDYVAEVLLENYSGAAQGDIDTLSWAAKALGKSKNPRYRDALTTVANNSNTNKKLRKYASNALDDLSDSKVPQYKRGGVSLKKSGSSTASAASHNDSTAASTTGKGQPLSAVKKGMTMAEAYGLVGEPTTSTGHVTGKAWIPFNFKGSDTARLYALYKGKGRIIFTNRSYYDHSWQVYEVQMDPSEAGYP